MQRQNHVEWRGLTGTSPGTTTDQHPAKVTGPQAHERLCTNDPRTVTAPDHVYVAWAVAIFESKFASVQDKNAAAERIACARSTAYGRANSRCVGPTQLPAGSRKGRRPSPIFGMPPGEPSRNGRLLDRWANSVLGFFLYHTVIFKNVRKRAQNLDFGRGQSQNLRRIALLSGSTPQLASQTGAHT